MDHEVFYHPVELASLVSLALRLLSQLLEVLNGLGNGSAEEADLDATERLTPHCDVEVNLQRRKKSLKRQKQKLRTCQLFVSSSVPSNHRCDVKIRKFN